MINQSSASLPFRARPSDGVERRTGATQRAIGDKSGIFGYNDS